MKEQKSILPSSFTKKYKNAKLIEILSDDMNWGMRDLGYSAKGRRELIQINSLLFDYIETLTDDIDFYLEPYDEDLFEMMPPWVSRQASVLISSWEVLNWMSISFHVIIPMINADIFRLRLCMCRWR